MKESKTTQEAFDDLHEAWDNLKITFVQELRDKRWFRIAIIIWLIGFMVIITIF